MRWLGILAGMFLACAALVLLWGAAILDPPEALTRRVAGLSALYPESLRGAEIERIPCPPLKRLRLYVVCTEFCDDTWVIVGIRGLWPVNLSNLGRIPPEPLQESRSRIAASVAQEHLSLDRDSAREMVGCYLRLEGFFPERVLAVTDLVSLEGERDNEEAMRRLAMALDSSDAVERIDPVESEDGFVAQMYYWDTSRPEAPVLELKLDLARNGVLRSLEESVSVRGGTVYGSTPDTPPF